jgi:hypothetical protein
VDDLRAAIANAVDVAFNDLRKEYGLSIASMDFPQQMLEVYESCIDDLAHLAEVWIEIELEE